MIETPIGKNVVINKSSLSQVEGMARSNNLSITPDQKAMYVNERSNLECVLSDQSLFADILQRTGDKEAHKIFTDAYPNIFPVDQAA